VLHASVYHASFDMTQPGAGSQQSGFRQCHWPCRPGSGADVAGGDLLPFCRQQPPLNVLLMGGKRHPFKPAPPYVGMGWQPLSRMGMYGGRAGRLWRGGPVALASTVSGTSTGSPDDYCIAKNRGRVTLFTSKAAAASKSQPVWFVYHHWWCASGQRALLHACLTCCAHWHSLWWG
jgi:hypothetical protein